jgi:hypothetical protein
MNADGSRRHDVPRREPIALGATHPSHRHMPGARPSATLSVPTAPPRSTEPAGRLEELDALWRQEVVTLAERLDEMIARISRVARRGGDGGGRLTQSDERSRMRARFHRAPGGDEPSPAASLRSAGRQLPPAATGRGWGAHQPLET